MPYGGPVVTASAVTGRRLMALDLRYDELLLAGGVLVVAQAEIWTGAPDPAWVFAVLAVPMCLSLAWWRRRPGAVLMVVIASQLAGALVEVRYAPLYQLFSFLMACFALAARAPLGKAIVGGLAAEAMFVVGGLLDPDPKTAGDWLFVTAMVTGTWFVGRTLYGRDRAVDLLEQRFGRHDEATGRLVREQQERIAREVHDVIAHTISVMVVQAGAAEQLVGDNRTAREALATIQRAGHDAVLELRRLLLMLRGEEESRTPQPGLAELHALVRDARTAGTDIRLALDPVRQLPPVMELAVYRIVQESLTNVRKHAQGATEVTIGVRRQGSRLDIDILDDGRATVPAVAGNGLLGIRERARLYGGDATAGPRSDVGFAVHAWMIVEELDDPRSAR